MFSNVFLIHSSTLLGRARSASVQLIQKSLSPLSQSGSVTIIDSNEPDDDLIARIESKGVDMVNVNAKDMDAIAPDFAPIVKTLHVRQVSNAMKHYDAISQISSSSCESSEYSLVLEDDTIFGSDIDVLLRRITDSLARQYPAPERPDIVFLSLPSPPPPSAPDASSETVTFHEFKDLYNALPACDAYLISREGALKMAAAMLPIRLPTNLQLSFLIRKLGARTVLTAPNAFIDGSKMGVFTSSIDPNNALIWNQPYCRVHELLSKAPDLEIALPEIRTEFSKQPFKDHPDALALLARFLTMTERFEEAREVYQMALERYDRENVLMDSSSNFLRSYMALFEHLQIPKDCVIHTTGGF
jgi:hypothetical protein